jgi:hypothetical protein
MLTPWAAASQPCASLISQINPLMLVSNQIKHSSDHETNAWIADEEANQLLNTSTQ